MIENFGYFDVRELLQYICALHPHKGMRYLSNKHWHDPNRILYLPLCQFLDKAMPSHEDYQLMI